MGRQPWLCIKTGSWAIGAGEGRNRWRSPFFLRLIWRYILPMAIHWSAFVKQPQTPLLLFGTALGYGLLIALAGNRPLVWLGGGAIATVMVGRWFKDSHALPRQGINDDSNLLNSVSFQRRMIRIQVQIAPDNHQFWQPVKAWTSKSQECAVRICDREPSLRPELLEALHTVVNLAQQVADGLRVQAQIQTPNYQQMAKQQLNQSCDRLKQTYLQLQQLQDQVALASLSQGNDALPMNLETLIAANKEILEL